MAEESMMQNGSPAFPPMIGKFKQAGSATLLFLDMRGGSALVAESLIYQSDGFTLINCPPKVCSLAQIWWYSVHAEELGQSLRELFDTRYFDVNTNTKVVAGDSSSCPASRP
jgi:hypothetical protein